MTLRPMSGMLRLAVIPEVERRVAVGELAADALPYQVLQFRWIQGAAENRIEINDQVKLVVSVIATRTPIAAGENLTLNDIDPAQCHLQRPEIDGKPAAYFLCRSSFLNFHNIFDFTPSDPSRSQEERDIPMRLAVADIAQEKAMLNAMKPIDKYQQLSAANWPPGPGYYPNLLWQVHSQPESLKSADFGDSVAKAYSEQYLRERLDFWDETKFFNSNRFVYVRKAIDEYLSGDYVSAIYVLVPHFEGIIKDYLTDAGVDPRYRLESCVDDLRKLVQSRPVLMFPRAVLDLIFAFIADGPFLAKTSAISDPKTQVTRHGVAHGLFMGFEDRDIALKYLILLDSLSYVILHDKIIMGTL